MRRSLSILFIMFVLCSCSSMFLTDNNTNTTKQEASLYSGQIYATTFSNGNLDKDKKILVFFDSTNLMVQMSLESTIVNSLLKYDISAVGCSYISVYSDINSFEDLCGIAEDNDCSYILFIELDDINTYQLGGGIATISFTSDIVDIKTVDLLFRATGSVSSKKNNLIHFEDSLEPAFQCLANTLANKYIEFIEED